MSAWCGKNDPLFCNCCTLLWLFAQDPTKASVSHELAQVYNIEMYEADAESHY
jgi:hypothetical protein